LAISTTRTIRGLKQPYIVLTSSRPVWRAVGIIVNIYNRKDWIVDDIEIEIYFHKPNQAVSY